jgi:ribulose 1,5-bisphosphate synthetase/thiazole synthase
MSLTAKKELKSGASVWTAYRRRIPIARRLTRDSKTDVLVVGAGISGALIAYALAREGHRVMVVESPRPAGGIHAGKHSAAAV